MTLTVGQIIDDKYQITQLIGEGGMGAVYAGENLRIKRKVAIKVLHAAVAGNAQVVERFEREAQAAGRIGNDHILEVLDLGALPDGARYMVMEFLDGEALGDRITRAGRLSPRQAYPLLRQTLEALQAAHGAGIIHRDLKPDNIFILREKAGHTDYVKLIDFGISKFSQLSGDAAARMTQTGSIMGTPYYMAPEQANGSRPVDARSDLYAMGVIAYETVTGNVPFNAESVNELLFKIVLAPPTPLETWVPDLDRAFGTLILKAISREPEDRFQTAVEFIAALDAWAKSGALVVVPPQQDGKTVMMAKMEAAAQIEKGKTAHNWAKTEVGVIPAPRLPKRGSSWLAMLGVIALGGVGVSGYFMLRGAASETTQTLAPHSDPTGANLTSTAASSIVAELAPTGASPAASGVPEGTSAPSASSVEAATPSTAAPESSARPVARPPASSAKPKASPRATSAPAKGPAPGATATPGPINIGY